MSKRTVLKTLAFLCGLYFFLEFLLPAKLGGDFDGDSVHSPAPVQTPSGPIVLYVGQYDQKKASMGRLVLSRDEARPWQRAPDEPVMQRTLFVPCEKSGMRQLDAVAGERGIDLFYLGLSREQNMTLCHAAGDASGLKWQRKGAVLFAANGIPKPTVAEANGELPGQIGFFAADREAGRWTFLLVMQRMGKGREVWSAEGESLAAMRLAPAPLLPANRIPEEMTAFDARRVDGRWVMAFAQASGGIRLTQEADGSFKESPLGIPPDSGTVTEMRLSAAGDRLFLACRRKSGGAGAAPAVPATGIDVLSVSGAGNAAAPPLQAVARAGRPAYVTPLSKGVETGANYLMIIGCFAVFIALINLTRFHGTRILRRQKGNVHSVIFFASVFAMATFTCLGRSEAAAGTSWRQGYDFLFDGIVSPMGTTVFSMITFYMISAAYRSFRIRSFEAALLMLSACVVMVGQMPIGAWLGDRVPDSMGFLRLPWLAEKLLTVINACAYRGVLIGLTVGQFSIGLRIWLGIDNSVYTGMEEKAQ